MDALLHVSTMKIVGIILIVFGLAIRYQVNKRRFNRRGPGGMQQYNSYGNAVVTSTLEKLLKIGGFIILLFGLLIVLLDLSDYNHQQTSHNKSEVVKKKK